MIPVSFKEIFLSLNNNIDAEGTEPELFEAFERGLFGIVNLAPGTLVSMSFNPDGTRMIRDFDKIGNLGPARPLGLPLYYQIHPVIQSGGVGGEASVLHSHTTGPITNLGHPDLPTYWIMFGAITGEQMALGAARESYEARFAFLMDTLTDVGFADRVDIMVGAPPSINSLYNFEAVKYFLDPF